MFVLKKKKCFDTGDVKLCICVCIYCIRHIENKCADVDWRRSEYSLLWLFFIMFIFVIVRSCPKKLVI